MVFSFKNYQILKVFFKIANLYTRKVKTKNARAEPGLKRTYMTSARFHSFLVTSNMKI